MPRLFLTIILALTLAACAGGTGPGSHAEQMAALGDKLRAGGYTVFLRHAHSEGVDKDVRNLSNCAAQRVLSAKGREQAKHIGESMRGASIGIGAVRASPFCRTLETARLAVGRASQARELMYHMDMKPADVAENVKLLAKQLGRLPPPGLNTLLVGHAPLIEAALKDVGPKAEANKPYIDEGEAIVVQATEQGYKFVAFIRATDWPLLAAAPRR